MPLQLGISVSDSIKCFRTLTRCFLGRQVTIGGVTTLLPIAIASPPEEITIDPKDKIEKLMTKACDGRKVVDFTYPDASEPEIELKFSKAVMELESLMHGRVVAKSTAPVEVMVFAEFKSSAAPGARAVGVVGNSVTAQTATSMAQVYYLDPVSKLATPIAVVGTSDTLEENECKIGAAMAFTLSPELIAKDVDIYAWVPCAVTGAVVMTAEPIGLISVFAQGISFDNKARLLIARNCTRMDSSPIADKPERTVKLSILTDNLSTSQLGWDFYDTNLNNQC